MLDALTIIDMQNGFCGNNSHYHGSVSGFEKLEKKMIDNIVERIKEYKTQGLPIILVEFNDFHFGETIAEITKWLEGYEHLYVVNKTQDNGGREIHKEIREKKLNVKEIEIVGINYDACVKRTHAGLIQRGYGADINKEATNYKIFKRSK